MLDEQQKHEIDVLSIAAAAKERQGNGAALVAGGLGITAGAMALAGASIVCLAPAAIGMMEAGIAVASYSAARSQRMTKQTIQSDQRFVANLASGPITQPVYQGRMAHAVDGKQVA